MKRFFASYSRKDRALVEPVVTILRTTRTEVFFDIDSIEPGEKWPERLKSALGESTTLILFWSKHAANSKWVRNEWKSALENKLELIPVILDETPLPKSVAEYQGVDFRDALSQFPPESKSMRHSPRTMPFTIVLLLIAALFLISVIMMTPLTLNDTDWFMIVTGLLGCILGGVLIVRILSHLLRRKSLVVTSIKQRNQILADRLAGRIELSLISG